MYVQVSFEAKGVGFPGMGITDGSEPPDIGADN